MTPLDRIDSVINEAASRITNAKPSDALRANVMSRIAAERPSRFAWRYVFAGGEIASIGLVARSRPIVVVRSVDPGAEQNDPAPWVGYTETSSGNVRISSRNAR